MSRRSRRNAATLSCHASSLGGPGVFGQYPSGKSGDTCEAFRLNSRMSHCAIRECSSNCHPVCGKPCTYVPRLLSGKRSIASMNCTCAPPPLSNVESCSRNTAVPSIAPPPLLRTATAPTDFAAVFGFALPLALLFAPDLLWAFFFVFATAPPLRVVLFFRNHQLLRHVRHLLQCRLRESRVFRHALELREGVGIARIRVRQHDQAERRREWRRHAIFIGHKFQRDRFSAGLQRRVHSSK